MTDLREALDLMLDGEPAAPDVLDQVLVAGRRTRRRRQTTLVLASSALTLAVIAILTIVTVDRGPATQSLSIAGLPEATPLPSPPAGKTQPAVVPAVTFPAEGINLAPATETAGSTPPPAALNARSVRRALVRNTIAREIAGAHALSHGSPSIQLRSVIESHPSVPPVTVNQAFNAWVVTLNGVQQQSYGSGPLPPGSNCTFVAIMDYATGTWTNFFTTCAATKGSG